MAQEVAILDFGSGKITVLIGKRGVNNTISMSGAGECSYAGFEDGVFYEPEQLSYVIGRALASAQASSRTQVEHLYIGVPGAFSTSVCKESVINLGKKKTVTETDVDTLHKQGNEFGNNPDYSVINIQPVYYTLDDDRRLVQPEGMKSTKLGGMISYILAENGFLTMMDKIMAEVGIHSYDYVSQVLAEALFLFDDLKRDRYVMFIDSGYITTDVVICRGDGILRQFNFSLGGAHITGELALHLNITFAQAEALKRKVNLSLDVTENDKYEISTGGDETVSFAADLVNEIVMNQIVVIAKTVAKSLSMCDFTLPDHIPYYLTGGGMTYIKGARDYLSKLFGRPVETIAPALAQYNRPHMSSSIGLMDMVLSCCPEEKKGFFSKLFKK